AIDAKNKSNNSELLDGLNSTQFLRADISNRKVEGAEYYASGWYRSTGNGGWYSQTHGGGIHMTDSYWVRIYNNKKFYVNNSSADAVYTAGGMKANKGFYWGNQSLDERYLKKTDNVIKRKSYSTTMRGKGYWDNASNRTFEVTGEVVTYPDGKIEQYFHFKNIKVAWLNWSDGTVRWNLPFWTAFPHKVEWFNAFTVQDSLKKVAITDGADEWLMFWDPLLTTRNSVHINTSLLGDGENFVDLIVKVEGY
ncbi:shufflon system plasmid conjugative transfer pilus tip adhesin PilV, partial [Phocoenobacter skyensis]